jgi:hypothetical protein
MKYLKRFNENSVRLAANIYFRSKEGDWMQGVNDPFTVNFCRINFPDGAHCCFKVLKEDFNSDFLNLKISTIDNVYTRNNSDFYISVYGDNIQFESLNEYKFVRKYMLKEDLLDHTFDSYIYSDNHNGPFEVSVKIVKSEEAPFGYGSECVIGFYNNALRNNITNYIKRNKEWKSEITDFFEDYQELRNLYEKIYDKERSEESIKPIDIKTFKDLNISGLFYLYYILRQDIKNKDILKEILKDDNGKVSIGKYLKIIGEFL